jgi:hypothetical protein
MTPEQLLLAAQYISQALNAQDVTAVIVVIPGSNKLFGTATFLTDVNEGHAVLGLVRGVTIRQLHPQLGLTTFDYVPQPAQV